VRPRSRRPGLDKLGGLARKLGILLDSLESDHALLELNKPPDNEEEAVRDAVRERQSKTGHRRVDAGSD
jgi:hypothetical protein